MSAIRSMAKLLPESMLYLFKHAYYRNQISRGRFRSTEQEFSKLDNWVSEGDWAIDIGANVGHYTRALASKVGKGRVIALEPHPETFSYLARNTADLENVTLLNTAASDSNVLLGFEVPTNNFYLARISASANRQVMSLNLGAIELPERVAFVKIDVEGHEIRVLNSLETLILRDKPVLMIENHGDILCKWAAERGYYLDDLPGSHNHILKPRHW